MRFGSFFTKRQEFQMSEPLQTETGQGPAVPQPKPQPMTLEQELQKLRDGGLVHVADTIAMVDRTAKKFPNFIS